MNKRFLFFAVFFLLFASVLFARGIREKAQTVQVTGIVRLVGSEPFTEIVISGSEYEWYIAREERGKLADLQHRTVTVEGEATVTELTFANGIFAGTRRELRNIRIIRIEEYSRP